ncbi:L-serine ammonia-lyase [Kushneria phosphatilytica]|uniref:L-serine dehydratase n=1 Tax=Kushneria phosphatilytica TaxID=657387 RepID=A0A1S1P1S4_9GAMM|nr:L-serine ammonia-lyase [Kushneria phosphatilytica]OHV12750.1 L-serine ammonia-lyase [Kushneria phosphatilytica]QEL10591.1 L-serine ammonia-lyase [Kushneria phosphatilytica]
MPISVFELFNIGIGPSSSHTVGPMRAARRFLESLQQRIALERVSGIEIHLHGSLAATGQGHGTDRAVIMGLMGEQPDRIDPAIIDPCIEELLEAQTLRLDNRVDVPFLWGRDLHWSQEPLPRHPNALTLVACLPGDACFSQTWYSLGGGFVVEAGEIDDEASLDETVALPYEFNSADELLELCQQHDLSIAELMLANEQAWHSEAEIRERLLTIWQAMQACVERGLHQQGTLPGGLNVPRRAPGLYQRLQRNERNLIATTFSAMEWVNLYALAVNEENAAGGRMVTAPTNGAAGIVPAVLHYWMQFEESACERGVVDFLLTAGAIGILCKKNASISGAEVGCQGEVGVACAMAAAGLAQVMGGTPAQIENAAEIGLEHNLGLTCDPVGGLVQVPCIERNAIASVKAINAAQFALGGDGTHFVSLDRVIRTMRDTGRDMQSEYKETSRGGLAVNAIEC